jgi:hypothetical protein
LTLLSISLSDAIRQAEEFRMRVAQQGLGGAGRSSRDIESDHKHALNLRRIAAHFAADYDHARF